MAAIWGLSGAIGQCDGSEIGRRLQHRGRREFEWAPAPHVSFAWRTDGATPASLPAPLMFTGGISNRHELAQRVGGHASDGSPSSDAMLLWELYRRDGANAFAQVNGQFAVALYDAQLNEVILAADRWGGRSRSTSRASMAAGRLRPSTERCSPCRSSMRASIRKAWPFSTPRNICRRGKEC